MIAGGALGALARHLVLLPSDGSLLVLVAINIGGSAVLGLVTGALGDRGRWRAFCGTGVLGGFTSYSALAPFLGALPLAGVGAVAGYAALAVASLAAVGAALGGLATGSAWTRGRRA
ncbi:CrcB family protein [Microbacterium sp. ZXX196]|uniref:CrcB family protein n=1 Tax=Microbacterium sp. ZXX196 TaxID=2609291 RepID=UPI001E4A0E50|nr:CrcB family protein [Microbacterium sp. ZXX196]